MALPDFSLSKVWQFFICPSLTKLMLKFCRSVGLKLGEAIPHPLFLLVSLWPFVVIPDFLALMAERRSWKSKLVNHLYVFNC